MMNATFLKSNRKIFIFFIHSLSEVEFLVEVDKERNTKIIEVDGRKLEEKKE